MNQTSISYPSISQGIAWFNYYFFQSTVVLFLSGFQMEIVAFCTSKMSQGHPAPGSGAGGKGKGQQPVLCSRNRAALLNDVPNLGKCRATRVLLGPELLPGIAWCCVEKVCSSEIVPHPSQNTWNVLFSNSYMLKKKKKKAQWTCENLQRTGFQRHEDTCGGLHHGPNFTQLAELNFCKCT